MPKTEIGKYTSKCIKCDRCAKEDNTFDGRNTYGFEVAFEDGHEGIYSAKDANKPVFKVGEVAEFSVTQLTSDKNPDWRKIIIKKVHEEKGGFKKLSPEEQKSIAYQVASEVAIDSLASEDHTNQAEAFAKIKANTAKFTECIVSKGLDSNTGRRASGCLRLGLRLFEHVGPIEGKSVSDSIILYANKFFTNSEPANFKN